MAPDPQQLQRGLSSSAALQALLVFLCYHIYMLLRLADQFACLTRGLHAVASNLDFSNVKGRSIVNSSKQISLVNRGDAFSAVKQGNSSKQISLVSQVTSKVTFENKRSKYVYI